jgi:hypothetical protein
VSQYPYQPPPQIPYGYGGYPQDPLRFLLAPAKRASIFLFVLSGLMFLCGVGIVANRADSANAPPAQAAQLRQAEQQLAAMGMSLEGIAIGMAAFAALVGVLFILLGVFVRRGGMGSVVTSIILCFALAIVDGLVTLGTVAKGGSLEACLPGLNLILSIFALVFLFQAAKNAGQVNAYRAAMYGAMSQYSQGGIQPGAHFSQQPQGWQQPAPGQWPQPGWPPQQQPPPQQQQNWPPPPPSNPA